MKLKEFENMSQRNRRSFLKMMSAALATPVTTGMVMNFLASRAEAQAAGPLNFIEINFRDQWDFGALFVPPAIAQNFENVRGNLAFFETPINAGNNFYLMPQAIDLQPHLADIAVMELGECVLPGNQSVHGHEAGNPLRSPGRTKTAGAGRIDMSTVDKRPGGRSAGNEILFSSSPTPAVLHNFYMKTLNSGLRNGVLLRSSIRTGTHTFYHFEGKLANAQLDRYFSKATFLDAFSENIIPTQSTAQVHGNLISSLVKKLDQRYMAKVLLDANSQEKQGSSTDALGNLLVTPPPPISVELSAAEVAAWTEGIGGQLVCGGDNANNCTPRNGAWNAGEIFGHAFKLIQSGAVKTVAVDFDMHDIHSNRTPFVMRTQAEQSGKSLARLIQNLKDSGLWDQTIIAMYTLDGSRSPASTSTGDGSKNAVVLAGGKIKGGYYGNISSINGQIRYFRPDNNGNPIAAGTTGRDMRVPASDIYKTVALASGIPMATLNDFPDIATGQSLQYMLK